MSCLLRILKGESHRKEVIDMAHMTANLSIRTDKAVKEQAQQIFSELGMDMTTAVNVFLRQVISCGGLPFAVRLHQPNPETLAALQEGDQLLQDPTAPRFSSVEALFEELEEE